MKILLVGEYSRLHNSLKEGLEQLGHQSLIIADGDHFKKFNVDYSIRPTFFSNNWFFQKSGYLIYYITRINVQKIERAIRFYLYLPKLKNFDVVQLINSDAIETYPFLSKYLLNKLFLQNSKISLLVCGDETPVVDYQLKNELRYSVLTPFFNNPLLKKEFVYSLKYTKAKYRKLFNFVFKKSNSLITSDLDYKIPMEKMAYNAPLIPNPINTQKIEFLPLKPESKICIFLGINRCSSIKKGSMFFEIALKVIQKKYPNKVEIIITHSIPYKQYINLYNKAHILLDQVYGYDQGYNALEAMAKGKVVFTGAEKEFTEHYNLTEKVAINALPDVDYLVKELSFLIENPEEIIAIGKRARMFIEKEHDYVKVAQKYLTTWGF